MGLLLAAALSLLGPEVRAGMTPVRLSRIFQASQAVLDRPANSLTRSIPRLEPYLNRIQRPIDRLFMVRRTLPVRPGPNPGSALEFDGESARSWSHLARSTPDDQIVFSADHLATAAGLTEARALDPIEVRPENPFPAVLALAEAPPALSGPETEAGSSLIRLAMAEDLGWSQARPGLEHLAGSAAAWLGSGEVDPDGKNEPPLVPVHLDMARLAWPEAAIEERDSWPARPAVQGQVWLAWSETGPESPAGVSLAALAVAALAQGEPPPKVPAPPPGLILAARAPALLAWSDSPSPDHATLPDPDLISLDFVHLTTSGEPPRFLTRRQIDALIVRAARGHLVPHELLRAVVEAESAFDPWAKSQRGAVGLMQLMPETARSLGVDNPQDPAQNVEAGARYLRQLLDRYDHQTELALAAYNWGPSRLDRLGIDQIPLQTQDFIQRVLENMGEVAREASKREP